MSQRSRIHLSLTTLHLSLIICLHLSLTMCLHLSLTIYLHLSLTAPKEVQMSQRSRIHLSLTTLHLSLIICLHLSLTMCLHLSLTNRADSANTENLAEIKASDWLRAQNNGFSLAEKSPRKYSKGVPLINHRYIPDLPVPRQHAVGDERCIV